MTREAETQFYSVSTPSFFREIELPADFDRWTSAEMKRFRRLEDAAERHGTYVNVTNYRLG